MVKIMVCGWSLRGANSGIKKTQATLFLESAYFDPKTIRRTSTRHGLRTDAAAMHFEKGIDPNITEKIIQSRFNHRNDRRKI